MKKVTGEEINSGAARCTIGLNLTIFGLIAGTAVAEDVFEGEALMAPARSSEKDLKLEQDGLEATGLAITVLPASLTSIPNESMYLSRISCACYFSRRQFRTWNSNHFSLKIMKMKLFSLVVC